MILKRLLCRILGHRWEFTESKVSYRNEENVEIIVGRYWQCSICGWDLLIQYNPEVFGQWYSTGSLPKGRMDMNWFQLMMLSDMSSNMLGLLESRLDKHWEEKELLL